MRTDKVSAAVDEDEPNTPAVSEKYNTAVNGTRTSNFTNMSLRSRQKDKDISSLIIAIEYRYEVL